MGWQLWTGPREIAKLIHYADYLDLAKTDIDIHPYNKLLKKRMIIVSVLAQIWNKTKKANRLCSEATQILQGEKGYYLIFITGATFISIIHFFHLRARATILSLTCKLKILDR